MNTEELEKKIAELEKEIEELEKQIEKLWINLDNYSVLR